MLMVGPTTPPLANLDFRVTRIGLQAATECRATQIESSFPYFGWTLVAILDPRYAHQAISSFLYY